MNQQRQNMQRQQEQLRQQMQGAAWQEQKAREKEARQHHPGPGRDEPANKFAAVMAEMERLQREIDAGRLSEAEFTAMQKELMVQDRTGAWWMVGRKTRKWYRNDGDHWVEANPVEADSAAGLSDVGQAGTGAVVAGDGRDTDVGTVRARRHRGLFLSVLIFAICAVITVVLGFAAGHVVFEGSRNSTQAWATAIVVWIIGLSVGFLLARGRRRH